MERTGFICQSCLSGLRHASDGAMRGRPRAFLAARTIAYAAATHRRPIPSPHPNAEVPSPSFLSSVAAAVSQREADSLAEHESYSRRPRAGRIEKYDPYAASSRPAGKSRTKISATGQSESPTVPPQPPGPSAFREWELALAELSQERTFDHTNYPSDDQAFWTKFEQTWADPAEEAIVEPATQRTNRPKNTTAERNKKSKAARQGGRYGNDANLMTEKKRQERHRELQEVVHLTRNCDPADRAQVKAQFKAWKRRFARLDSMVAGEPPRTIRNIPGEDDLTRLLALGDVDPMREAWQQKPRQEQASLWADLMLAALRVRPDDAHLVLRATFEEPATPFYAVRDVVAYLVRRSTLLGGEEKKHAVQGLSELVPFLLENSSNRYLQFPQSTLHTLAKVLPTTDAVARLYGELVRYQHLVHANTLLHFAGRLSKDASHKSTALRILQSILQSGTLGINAPRGAALCTSILSLRKSDVGSPMSVTPAELFESLLDLGLSPNLLTYSVIIRNLCLNRELHTAWQVLDTMTENGIRPDAHLYSILLNGAKLCQDFSSLHRVVLAARADNVRDPVVWNDLLHALFLPWLAEARKRRMRPPRVLPAFPLMLRAYAKIFQLEPLRTLTSPDVDRDLHREEEGAPPPPSSRSRWHAESQVLPLVADLAPLALRDLVEPGSDTLGIMLIGYVRGFSKPYNIIAFYARFRSLLQEGDPAAVRLVEERGTLVYDVVIKAVVEWDGLLPVALEVVSEMLKGAELAPSSSSGRSQPAPSVYTWSILLNGFTYHRKASEAERILRMMRDYGVEPTIVTWNTLLAGYTRAQQADKTVKTFQRIESAGLEPDDFTYKAFSYLRDPGRVLQRMEEMVARRKSWLDGDAGEKPEATAKTGVFRGGGGPSTGGDVATITGQLRELESEAERAFGPADDEAEHERTLGHGNGHDTLYKTWP